MTKVKLNWFQERTEMVINLKKLLEYWQDYNAMFMTFTPQRIFKKLIRHLKITFPKLNHHFNSISIHLQFRIEINCNKSFFCESTQTANWIELSRTACQTLKEVERNNTIRNFKRKWTVDPIQWGRYEYKIEKYICDLVNVSWCSWHSNYHVCTR